MKNLDSLAKKNPDLLKGVDKDQLAATATNHNLDLNAMNDTELVSFVGIFKQKNNSVEK